MLRNLFSSKKKKTGKSVGVIGLGYSLGKNKITNFDLEKKVDTNDEWIRRAW